MYYIAFVSDVTLKRKVEMELILKNQEINQLNESLEEEVLLRTKDLQNTLAKLEENTKVLEGALQKEKELGDLKTRFVSMASHEFRTPLTSIISSASLIEKYPKEEEQAKRLQHINRIKNSVNNMTEILEEFLSVGKLAEGRVETHISEIVLAPFFQELIAELRGQQKDTQKIVLHLDKTETFISDASILRKVLINGLSNALKFSQRDVHLYVQYKKHELHIDIVDSGIGISEDDQKHLFERFFRGGNASVIQGTGLGLHLIDRYVRLIQGKVDIYSQLGQGTTLSMTIPAAI
jgi:signal transduction histidine kinase